jgi:subtilisin family serine protease
MQTSSVRRRLAATVAALALGMSASAGAAPPTVETACGLAVPKPTLLVSVRPGAEGWLRRTASAAGARVVGGLPALHALELAFDGNAALDRALGALRADPRVRSADVESTYHVLDAAPADPMYKDQWGLKKISAPKAWGVESGAKAAVTVAVIDTGADFGHPDLAGKLLTGFNVLNPGAQPQDDHLHGTHVSGIIAAATNNRIGVAGVSWGARILPVKPMDANGSGTLCDIVAAVLYVASQQPEVLNMSIGAPGPCPAALQEALDLAYQAGVTSVAAAGNGGAGFNLPSNPANCDHTIGVAATDPNDKAASFSNYGSYVDVSAPGVNILSTVIEPKARKHTYAALSGTSMASPMVAGLAALVAAHHPDWTPDQITQRILTTCDDLGPRGWDQHFGRGRINAQRAVS